MPTENPDVESEEVRRSTRIKMQTQYVADRVKNFWKIKTSLSKRLTEIKEKI
jgi:hypothetical protein